MLFAQEFKPFIQSAYFDILAKAIPTADGGFVTMEIIPGRDFQSWDIKTKADINDYGFSNIVKYNKHGIKVKSLKLPDTDSTIFFTSDMIRLSNGKYCIAGDYLNSFSNSQKLFFVIVDENLTDFENINIIDLPNFESCGSVLEYFNEDLIFLVQDYNGGAIKQYKQDGSFVRQYDITNCGIDGPRPNLAYLINKDLVFYCLFLDRFVFLDENFNETVRDAPYFTTIGNKKIGNIDYKNKVLNNGEIIFKASTIDTSQTSFASAYANVFKMDSNKNISIIYNDTSKFISNRTFNFYNSVVYSPFHKIFAVFNDNSTDKTSLMIVCLTKDGTLKWKKQIIADIETSQYTGFLTADFATNDGGLIFTILADDEFGEADTYYYKIDSNGNKVDFTTGLFSIGPEIEINDFILFPNPAKEKIFIETSLRGNFNIKIMNVLGEIIINQSVNNHSKITVEKLPKGTYFYQILSEKFKVLQQGKFLMK